jgi:voltage-gated potassium channel
VLRRGIHRWRELKRRLSELLERGLVGDTASRIVDRGIVVLIVLNLVAITLQSVPELSEHYRVAFAVFEAVSLLVFSVEYALRIWVASEHLAHCHLRQRLARWQYVTSWPGIVDLLAVVPFWFAFAVPADLRVLQLLRILRFLELARYSPGMRSLLDALYAERRALAGCFLILIGATLLSATAMHLVERHGQPDTFGTIPDAMWWAIVTLGTIGYGDVMPVTVAGRLVASATIFAGFIMIALPVRIVATAFAEQSHRRDFV